MSRTKRGSAVVLRGLTAVRAGFGLVQLAGSWPLSERSSGRRLGRVLGARHLVQAAVSASAPAAPLLALGLEADLLHAMSMFGLALARRSDRRAASVQAVVALAFAAAGADAMRQAARTPAAQHELERSGPLRVRDKWAQALAHQLVPERLTPAVHK
jgi:hypothetical protein